MIGDDKRRFSLDREFLARLPDGPRGGAPGSHAPQRIDLRGKGAFKKLLDEIRFVQQSDGEQAEGQARNE